jgi:hypothetical protein
MFQVESNNTILYQKRMSISQPPIPKPVKNTSKAQTKSKFIKIETPKIRRFISPSPINSKIPSIDNSQEELINQLRTTHCQESSEKREVLQ